MYANNKENKYKNKIIIHICINDDILMRSIQILATVGYCKDNYTIQTNKCQ